ncbi:efflux RND transporter periplasmic adaptor subunit [candidate division WOR-3 bacterium]|nr:efflux RND transporter periplasmic adaptor subunit [candidate division WOR-3 bacterium]
MGVKRGRVIVLVVAGIAVAGVLHQISAPWRATAVEVTPVERGALSDSLAVTGTVEARTVTVSPKVPGRVRAVHAASGDEVPAGRILIELDNEEMAARLDEATAAVSAARARQAQAAAALEVQRATASARLAQAEAELAAARAQRDKARAGARPQERQQAAARVAQAKVALDQARREHQRMRDLVARGALPQSALDAARAAEETAQSQYDAALQAQSLIEAGAQPEDIATAEARVRQAEALVAAARAAAAEERVRAADLATARAAVGQAEAALRAARAQLAATTIAAPIAGTVVRKNVEVGELVTPGTALLTLADLREVWVTVDLAAGDVAKVRQGQDLEVRSDAYPGRVFPAKITELSRVADPRFGVGQAWSIRAKVAPTDPDRLLRPGVQVDIEGTGVVAANALLVPATAIVTRLERTGVFVVAGGIARFRPVEIGVRTSKRVQVLGGVKMGDRVVAAPAEGLRDGMRVRTR